MQPKNNLPTPHSRLLERKEQLRQQCRQQEEKLSEDYAYFQENAPSLLLSGLSFLLFGSGKSKKTNASAQDAGLVQQHPVKPLALSDFFAIGKELIPFAIEIVQPLLLSWGIRKVRGWFTKKKKIAAT
jgi:hypothetical protein